MGDFKPLIGPGLGVANQLIDKHFDKLPNSAFRRETYHPKNIHIPIPGRHRKSRKDRRGSKDSHHSDYEYESDRETRSGHRERERRHTQSIPRSEVGNDDDHYYSRPPTELSESNLENHDRSMTRVPPNYGDSRITSPIHSPEALPIYSHEPPRQRSEYLPSPPPSASANPYYNPPAPNRMAMNRGRDVDPYRDDDYYSDTYHAPRRPKAVTRRSSSYHGPRSKDDYGYGKQVSRRKGSGSEVVDRARDTAHRYKLKDDMNNMFTATPEGLVGGAAGAALGGWAAQKAQIGYSKKGSRHDPNPLLTLIGATVGGLAINSLVDKYQDGKKETAKKEKRWDEKYGSEDESDDGRSYRSSHRSQRSHHRRRRDSYD